MTKFKRGVFASTAAVALLAAAPAMANDLVTWNWWSNHNSTITSTIDVTTDVDTSGVTQIEKMQIHIGDVSATSTVTDITNNPPAGGDGVATIDETFSFSTMTDDSTDPSTVIGPVGGVDDGDSDLSATLLDGGTLDEGTDDLDFQVQVTGSVVVPADDALDAETQLPTIDSAATAVGNNQAIESEVATYLHDAQIQFDTVDSFCETCGADALAAGAGVIGAVLGYNEFSANAHTGLAVAAGALAVGGVIDKSQISASSSVSNILNARVDSAATAVANNMSVDVNSDEGAGDSVLIGDLTQFAAADVMATSGVTGVTVNNYANLAAVNPLVGSSATAVGNNVSISVGVPDVE